MSNEHQHIVAIDGPIGVGQIHSVQTGGHCVEIHVRDSGALYRGMTWKAIREGVDVKNGPAVVELMNRMQIEFFAENMISRIPGGWRGSGAQLRSEPVRENVSDIAAIPEVRTFMVNHFGVLTRLAISSWKVAILGPWFPHDTVQVLISTPIPRSAPAGVSRNCCGWRERGMLARCLTR
jgi:hypothetical protein